MPQGEAVAAIQLEAEPGTRVHVYGIPEAGPSYACTAGPMTTWPGVVYHIAAVLVGEDWICLDCGSTSGPEA